MSYEKIFFVITEFRNEGNTAVKPFEKLSNKLFETFLREILLICHENIDNMVSSFKTKGNSSDGPADLPDTDEEFESCLLFIQYLSFTSCTFLIPVYLFYPLLVKCSLLVDFYVTSQLKQNFNQLLSNPAFILDSFKHIEYIEKAHQIIIKKFMFYISRPFENISNNSKSKSTNDEFLMKKLSNIIFRRGNIALSDGIIELSSREMLKRSGHSLYTEANTTSSFGLQSIFHQYLISSDDRISPTSKNARQIVKYLHQYASEKCVKLLELVFENAIVDWVFPEMRSALLSLENPISFRSLHHANKFNSKKKLKLLYNSSRSPSPSTSLLVLRLIQMLKKARDISFIDMSSMNSSKSAADKAFAIAYRKLSTHESYQFTRSVVVHISFLLDKYKQNCFERGWQNNLNSVVDLIQVLFPSFYHNLYMF